MRKICAGRKFLTGPLVATGHPWDSELVFRSRAILPFVSGVRLVNEDA
jgi:hypothetical protein